MRLIKASIRAQPPSRKTVIARLALCAILTINCLGLTGCNHQKTASLPGYFEGVYTYVSTNSSGILKFLYVTRGNSVQAGQPLFIIDMQPEDDQLKVAQERVIEAAAQQGKSEANYKLQKILFDRKFHLYEKKVKSKEELDTALASYQEAYAGLNAAKANLAVLEAELKKAEWTVQQKTVNANTEALVFDTYYRPGELITSGHPILSLLNPADVKIIFYCPEPLLTKIKLNQSIDVLGNNNQKSTKAKISFISPQAEYTPPIIYSDEVRQKLVYRIEARPFTTPNLAKLHTGQPVTIQFSYMDK